MTLTLVQHCKLGGYQVCGLGDHAQSLHSIPSYVFALLPGHEETCRDAGGCHRTRRLQDGPPSALRVLHGGVPRDNSCNSIWMDQQGSLFRDIRGVALFSCLVCCTSVLVPTEVHPCLQQLFTEQVQCSEGVQIRDPSEIIFAGWACMRTCFHHFMCRFPTAPRTCYACCCRAQQVQG